MGFPSREFDKSFLEGLLEFLADPNVSFLLFTLGGLGIIIELFNPGLLVPVIVGVICLILAFVGVGNLPVNWAGVALILLAIVLGAAEVAVVGFGVLGVASAVSLIIGGLLLFAQFGETHPTLPYIGVNRWLLVGGLRGVGSNRDILGAAGREVPPRPPGGAFFSYRGPNGLRHRRDAAQGGGPGCERYVDCDEFRWQPHRRRRTCQSGIS